MNSVRVSSLEQKGYRLSFEMLNIDLIGGRSVSFENRYMGIGYIVLRVFLYFKNFIKIQIYFESD